MSKNIMDAFVCKIVVIDTKEVAARASKMKKLEPRQPKGAIKKCLFGVPDPLDTEKMVQEQYEIDRKRFMDRFGIDLQQVEHMESSEYNDENVDTTGNGSKKSSVEGRKVLKAHRKALKLLSTTQHVITDFYQTRKTVQSQEKDAKLTKEN